MANKSEHLIQWKHNRSLLSIVPPDYPDWIITITFYVALHACDSLLAHDKVSLHSHDSRNQTLIATNRYNKIWKHYQPLYSLSRTIRYMAKPKDWVPVEAIPENVFARYLYPIERSVMKLLGENVEINNIKLKNKI